MPKYLIQTSLTTEGVRGTMKEGGSKRKEAIEAGLKSVGGRLEAMYYAFGETDVYLIVDLPDNISAMATALIGTASGTSRLTTVVLSTPEEMDKAAAKATQSVASYRPPGR